MSRLAPFRDRPPDADESKDSWRWTPLSWGPVHPMGHGADCLDVEYLTVREVAMIIVMDRFTDRPEWESEIFDDGFTSQWIIDTLKQPVKPLYREIVGGRGKKVTKGLQPLRSVLDRSCLNYVRF